MSAIVTDTILEIAKLLLIICGIKMIFYQIKQRSYKLARKVTDHWVYLEWTQYLKNNPSWFSIWEFNFDIILNRSTVWKKSQIGNIQ